MRHLILLLNLIPFCLFAQNATFKTNHEHKQHAEKIAKAHIDSLKDGVIFVRLKTYSAYIERLRKHGNHKAADLKIEAQNEENQRIINAFRRGFDFCPVYFFPDTCSRNILNRKFDKVVFYSDSLTIDTTIIPSFASFYIVELGITEDDPNENYADRRYIKTDEEKGGTKKHVYGGTTLGVYGFVIRDRNFNQLRRPFPYYVKVFEKFPTEFRYVKRLTLWNKKLNDFVKQSTI